MNNTPRDNQNHARDGIDWRALDDSAKVRALADGELPPDAEAELRRSAGDAVVDTAVGFESTLRQRCGECMGDDGAPTELRAKVVGAMKAEALDVIQKTDRGFWAGGGRALIGLAAVIALAAAVWVISPTGNGPDERYLEQAAEHISGEHTGCELNPQYFQAKNALANLDESPEAFISQQIGDLPVHLELDESSYKLAGVGGCHLPGPGKSVHLLYEPVDPLTHGAVSLFVQEATEANQTLKEGVVYSNGTDAAPYLRIWREGRVVYYMATSCPVGCNTVESAYALTGKQIPL